MEGTLPEITKENPEGIYEWTIVENAGGKKVPNELLEQVPKNSQKKNNVSKDVKKNTWS